MEIETIKKSKEGDNQDIENLGKRLGIIDASISNRKQGIEERISKYHRKHWHNSQRNCKKQKAPKTKHPGNWGRWEMRRWNQRIIGIEQREDS